MLKRFIQFLLKNKLLLNSLLASLAAFFYALAFPNFINEVGFGFLAFCALIPIPYVISNCRWKAIFYYAFLFTIIFYLTANFWLITFNPLSFLFVLSVRFLQTLLLFFILKFIDSLFKLSTPIIQSLVWVGWEYLIAQGFLAYSFGAAAYSQYLFIPFIQVASIFGVVFVSLLIIFPSFYIGNLIKKGFKNIKNNIKNEIFLPITYIFIFCINLIYGFFSQVKIENLEKINVSCIQPNSDPWKGGDLAYEKNLNVLIKLSKEAQQKNTVQPDLIIWPETALVPSYRLHDQMRYDLERYNRIIKPFALFLKGESPYYLIGNNDREFLGRGSKGEYLTRDYNAALLFKNIELKGVYRKVKLVPFTEYFPYKDILPKFYEWLQSQDTHFYEPGNENDEKFIFEIEKASFGVLICFEDTFPYLARAKTKAGADFLINLTNDSWSNSNVAQIQHLAQAVFRAVENRRTLIRSTISGISCAIDPNGRIYSQEEPFAPTFLNTNAYLNKDKSVYSIIGEIFALFTLALSYSIIIIKTALCVFQKLRRKAKI